MIEPLMRSLLAVTAALVWTTSGMAAEAQQGSFPSGTIRLVAPNSAGTPPDIISRILAKELSEAEGWRVIVENRPGGITTIAASDVLAHPADGHSLFAMAVPSAAAPSLLPTIPYRFDADFEPVIKASVSYNVLVVIRQCRRIRLQNLSRCLEASRTS